MKLASLGSTGRDGRLVVVDRRLEWAVAIPYIAHTLQSALDDWRQVEPELRRVAERLERGQARGAFPLDVRTLAAPLPRAYQWADGSAYLNHVELVRKARGAEMPASFLTDPLMYQGGADRFLAPTEPITAASDEWGIDFEAEVAVVTDEVPMGTPADRARDHVKLIVLVNDVTLRNLVPGELAKGFGFFQSKPASALSPVAVTPDELGDAWDGGKVSLPLLTHLNGRLFGRPNAGVDMQFDFAALLAHAARTRALGPGSIVGGGTVSNRDRSVGSSCIAEKRAIETIEQGKPVTPFLAFGDRVRIEMLDGEGRSIFGAIDQTVVRS